MSEPTQKQKQLADIIVNRVCNLLLSPERTEGQTELEVAQLLADVDEKKVEAITRLFTRYKTGHFRDCICNICELEKQLNQLLQ